MLDLPGDIDGAQQLIDCFGAHTRVKFVDILFNRFQVLLIGQQLATFKSRHAGVDHHIGFKIENPLDILERHIEQQTDARRQ